MASSKVMWVFCLLTLLAFTSCSYHVRGEDHATKEKNEVMEYCKRYIFKNYGDQHPDPHRKCCQIVRESRHIHAICQKFTHADLHKISLAKWAHVTYWCGNGLHPGTNCAGFIVPDYSAPPPPEHSA
ncbi:hypothetical protein ACQJBY_021190 [Aegilops geniculata]